MRHYYLLFLLALPSFLFSQDLNQKSIDSLENSFKYEHGKITLKNGIATINVPAGFKYLNAEQANRVLGEIWGNPNEDKTSLGFLMPEKQTILNPNGYLFNIEYDEIGYVKDDDADEIDYNELLTELKKDTEAENAERVKNGYPKASLVGWASTPFYDDKRKVLHWAKEIKFGNDSINTLNYNIRILGRKGVLVLNAISPINELSEVKKNIPNVLGIVEFKDDLKYSSFDSSIDKVAEWTIGGLIAGKVLAKVGFFAMILKFWKVIALAVGGFFAAIRKKLFGEK